MQVRYSRTDRAGKVTEWLVYRRGGVKARRVGTVVAPNRVAALAVAYEELCISGAAERRRIIVLRTTDMHNGEPA